jgi:hypothetical protein
MGRAVWRGVWVASTISCVTALSIAGCGPSKRDFDPLEQAGVGASSGQGAAQAGASALGHAGRTSAAPAERAAKGASPVSAARTYRAGPGQAAYRAELARQVELRSAVRLPVAHPTRALLRVGALAQAVWLPVAHPTREPARWFAPAARPSVALRA